MAEAKYTLRSERLFLNNGGQSRQDYYDTIRWAVEGGGVQKLVVQLGEPLYVERLVKEGTPPPAESAGLLPDPGEDIRRAQVEELKDGGAHRFPLNLNEALNLVADHGLFPRFVLTDNREEFLKALSVDVGCSSESTGRLIFGHMPVFSGSYIPERAAVLAATNACDSPLSSVVLAIKFYY